MQNEKIKLLNNYIQESNNIVFFGGAGVSTESNIPDFRSADGIFNKKLDKHFTPEQLVSHSFYQTYPKDFFEFYKKNMIYENAKPNTAHLALARLERDKKLKAVITQNIDGLHQAAGSKTVYELHGSIHSNTCELCKEKFNLKEFLSLPGDIPKCPNCGAIVKPDVVLYEEALDESTISKAIEAISKADLLIVGGTSLLVYPAAGFLNYFKGKHLVLINKTSTAMDKMADLIITDSIACVFKELLNI